MSSKKTQRLVAMEDVQTQRSRRTRNQVDYKVQSKAFRCFPFGDQKRAALKAGKHWGKEIHTVLDPLARPFRTRENAPKN